MSKTRKDLWPPSRREFNRLLAASCVLIPAQRAFGDFDNDGDVDVLVNNMHEPPSLLRNDCSGRNNWIKVKCIGTKSNRSGIGARVRVVTRTHSQIDEVMSGSSYISHSDFRLHFGLGRAMRVDQIAVRWPSGSEETFSNLEPNHLIFIEEGRGITKTSRFTLMISSLAKAQLDHVEASRQLLNEGKLDQAAQEAQLPSQDPATRPLALAMLGTIRLREGKYDEGAGLLKRALEIDPRLAGARTTLGDVYLLQNKPELARKCFVEVLRLDPGNFNARLDLAKLEASQHNHHKSLELARPIATQLSQTEEGILLLATDYCSLGQQKEAEALVSIWLRLQHLSQDPPTEFGHILMSHGWRAKPLKSLKLRSRPLPAMPLSRFFSPWQRPTCWPKISVVLSSITALL